MFRFYVSAYDPVQKITVNSFSTLSEDVAMEFGKRLAVKYPDCFTRLTFNVIDEEEEKK